MGTLTIRGLDDGVKDRLRVEAARNGRSVAAEVRAVLEERYPVDKERGLGSRIHARFAELGGIEPEEWLLPTRDEPARYVDFEQ